MRNNSCCKFLLYILTMKVILIIVIMIIMIIILLYTAIVPGNTVSVVVPGPQGSELGKVVERSSQKD